MKTVVFAVLVMVGLAVPVLAENARTQFNDLKYLEQVDPSAAYAGMLEMARGDYTPAKDRVAFYLRNGLGTDKDLASARRWYKQAVADEHPWSFANLARVEIELGQGDAALAVLQAAVQEDRPGTRLLLGTGHIDGHFGVASDPELGRNILTGMAEQGDAKAAHDLIARINWKRLPGPASDTVVALVEETGLAGDARHAEAALIYLSGLEDQSEATLARRAVLADVSGIREQVLAPERIRLAAAMQPAQFPSLMEEVLGETGPETYARAASTAFWIDQNAWVRVLQMELREKGYYAGRINGRMTTRTIRAQARFCRDVGIWDVCATGPLRGPTVRAVADAIAQQKPQS
ncbi:hypothetical protein KUV51_01775 [Tateyamaria omphalii]|uniref:hypothetical protein n=1 Tax=Tateyamaria omphalii TaxID=299262 RepID=UPI001C991E69|nr:hypothetical protein [Tateyamaria omphalii]MBY5931713.1 hypothetical protein [Tateyamaria omphalii]